MWNRNYSVISCNYVGFTVDKIQEPSGVNAHVAGFQKPKLM